MENNNQDQLPEDEIPDMEQFQVDRSLPDNGDAEQQQPENPDTPDGDPGYTEQEVEFADGKGTRLNEQTQELTDEDDEEIPPSENDDAYPEAPEEPEE